MLSAWLISIIKTEHSYTQCKPMFMRRELWKGKISFFLYISRTNHSKSSKICIEHCHLTIYDDNKFGCISNTTSSYFSVFVNIKKSLYPPNFSSNFHQIAGNANYHSYYVTVKISKKMKLRNSDFRKTVGVLSGRILSRPWLQH